VTIVSPHSLRHTLATEALVDGADAASLSAFGGWADRKTLLGTYVHASSLQRGAAAARVIGTVLDRVYEAKPTLELVDGNKEVTTDPER